MDRRTQEKMDDKVRMWDLLDKCRSMNLLGVSGLIISIVILPALIMLNNFRFDYNYLFPGYAFASVGTTLPLLSLFLMYLDKGYFKDEDEIYYTRHKKKAIKIALPSLSIMLSYLVILMILSPAE
jgi:hypothetical protein